MNYWLVVRTYFSDLNYNNDLGLKGGERIIYIYITTCDEKAMKS